ncbi:MAG: hypothetical protein KatS3mg111_3998 [Pirellulaceae bacterium]|nr:MAG: hypothetical protein KatS3mg111_3998 [Pirellulaceae bacterium]
MITGGESVQLNLRDRAALDGEIERPHPDESSRDISASLSVIVPCYNEAPTVVALLRRVRRAVPEAEIIVVDDGSTDGTGELIDGLAREVDLHVLRMEANAGKGAAVRRGLKLATRRWVVIQDADLEYEPEDLRRLAEEADSGSGVAVYGSRFKRRGHVDGGRWLNYVGVRVLALLQWLLYGRWLSDPHTCYKMIRRDVLRAMNLRSRGFELCAEINSRLLRAGYEIAEVPIRYEPRGVAEGKKIGIRDFFSAAWTYVRYRFSGSGLTRDPQDGRSSLSVHDYGYVASRVAIGCLLLLAGASKIAPLSPMAITSWWIVPAPMVLVGSVIEIALGWACLTLVPHRLLRAVFDRGVSVLLVCLGDQVDRR